MEFVEIKNSNLVVTEYGDETNINLEKIQDIKSSIESNLSNIKILFYGFLGMGILLTILNIRSNYSEKIVPKDEIKSIYYERGYDQYKIQPGGDGTSSYPVHIGKDNKFYYSKDPVAFIFFEFGIFCAFFLVAIIQLKKLLSVSECYKEDNHFIAFFVTSVGRQKVYVGDFSKTKKVLGLLRNESKKSKLK